MTMQNYNIIATHHIILKGFSIAVDEFGVYNAFANLDPICPPIMLMTIPLAAKGW